MWLACAPMLHRQSVARPTGVHTQQAAEMYGIERVVKLAACHLVGDNQTWHDRNHAFCRARDSPDAAELRSMAGTDLAQLGERWRSTGT